MLMMLALCLGIGPPPGEHRGDDAGDVDLLSGGSCPCR